MSYQIGQHILGLTFESESGGVRRFNETPIASSIATKPIVPVMAKFVVTDIVTRPSGKTAVILKILKCNKDYVGMEGVYDIVLNDEDIGAAIWYLPDGENITPVAVNNGVPRYFTEAGIGLGAISYMAFNKDPEMEGFCKHYLLAERLAVQAVQAFAPEARLTIADAIAKADRDVPEFKYSTYKFDFT